MFHKATHKRILKLSKKMHISKNAFLTLCIKKGILAFAKTNLFFEHLRKSNDKDRV